MSSFYNAFNLAAKVINFNDNDDDDENFFLTLTQTMIKEIIEVNGNKVIIKEGKVKTILNKDIRQTDFMDIETAFNNTQSS